MPAVPPPVFIRSHILIWLAIALAPAFAVTGFVTRAYRAEHRELAIEWQERGEAALIARRPEAAIEAFRTALVFAGEDRSVTLRLAQALASAGRVAEARAYLLTVWDEQPGNGAVNLSLARLAAGDREIAAAIRYYHNAIEGAWRESSDRHRRAARVELVELLIQEGVSAQAQAEAIALAGDLPEAAAIRLRVAHLLFRADLSRRALALYEDVLRQRPDDATALEGAGRAAFTDRNYSAAIQYLTRAARRGSLGADPQEMLDTARLVVAADPYQRRISGASRRARVSRALDAAVSRLDECAGDDGSRAELEALAAEAAAMRQTAGRRALARDPDLVDAVMDLVFRIERQTVALCGEPAGLDRALLLIAEQRQGGSP